MNPDPLDHTGHRYPGHRTPTGYLPEAAAGPADTPTVPAGSRIRAPLGEERPSRDLGSALISQRYGAGVSRTVIDIDDEMLIRAQRSRVVLEQLASTRRMRPVRFRRAKPGTGVREGRPPRLA